MKVAILSTVKSLNYGASLQVYALERALEIKYPDIKIEYLNYRTDKKISVIKWFGRKIKSIIFNIDDSPSYGLLEFIKELFKFSKNGSNTSCCRLFEEFWNKSKYSVKLSRKDLKKIANEYDLFIVGSDQVWNCGKLDLDTTYLLDFVHDNSKKCNYASSLGMDIIPVKYAENYYRYLSRFANISCREKSGAKLLTDFLNRKVENVADPTFLLGIEDWRQVMDKELSSQLEGEKYILIYQLEDKESDILQKLALNFTKEGWNIKIIYGLISENNNIGPSQWLSLLYNASMVLTDSFHGTVFSLIFEKKFISYIPEGDFFKASSSRITDLLEDVGLKNRIYNKNFNISEIDNINYDNVKMKLYAKVSDSKDYLYSIMGETVNV